MIIGAGCSPVSASIAAASFYWNLVQVRVFEWWISKQKSDPIRGVSEKFQD